VEFVEAARYFFVDPDGYDEAAVAKHFTVPGVLDTLHVLAETYAALPRFDADALEQPLRSLAASRGLKPATLIHATRLAVTGRSASPGLFEVLALVGRDRVVARLRAASAPV
jgi:glutamyl-tRNA synthetase